MEENKNENEKPPAWAVRFLESVVVKALESKDKDVELKSDARLTVQAPDKEPTVKPGRKTTEALAVAIPSALAVVKIAAAFWHFTPEQLEILNSNVPIIVTGAVAAIYIVGRTYLKSCVAGK